MIGGTGGRSTSSNLASLLREFELTKELLVRMVSPAPGGPHPGDVVDDVDEADREPEAKLAESLMALRQAMLVHPAAAQALIGFLVAEGERRAATPEGAARYEAMVRSPNVERLRTIWEKVTLNLLDDHTPDETIPEAWVELIRDLAAGSGLDRVADRLRPDGLT